MPPKKKPNEPSKKTETKKKEKIIEDKTFGLKNKKGTKQQKFIKNVTSQVQHGNQKTSKLATLEAEKTKKKDEKKKLQDEINALFKPVSQTLSKGADPKSVLCAFFKQGQCTKGDKCKFSHDLNVERKSEKRNMYEDKQAETMADWDEATLEDVINKKHGESEKSKPKTAIICKFFLDAVENSKYGWFWECPNGAKCFYRHALPPGFVLKKDLSKDDKEDQISIEDLIETERAALGFEVTKVTLESFLKWKERKKREKMVKIEAEQEKKKADYKAGKTVGISGRQMFEFNPDLIIEDDDEVQDYTIERQIEEDDGDDTKVVDINLESFSNLESDVDNTGTQATTDRFQTTAAMVNGEAGKLDEAAALPSDPGSRLKEEETDAAIAAAIGATINGDLDIDEDLFDGDDIDLIDDDLENLDLEDNANDL